MSLSDPIGDMIARIKNALVRNHKKVTLPSSNFKVKIADILKNEGFIKEYKIDTEDKKPVLSIDLKYYSGNRLLVHLKEYQSQEEEFFQVLTVYRKLMVGLVWQ